MRPRAPWWRRAIAALRQRQIDRDFEAERAAHLQLAADDLERQGIRPEDARRQAKLRFGSEPAAADLHREARGLPTLESLARDFRHALRRVRRDAWLSTAVVVILGLGIGANTAVVSVIRPILLKGLPFDRGDELVWISNTGTAGLSGATFQVDTYEGLKQRARSFVDWTAYFAFSSYGTNTLTGLGDPERLHVMNVAPRFFELLGVTPALGRLFTAEEQALNGPGAVLVGHDYWQRRLGGRTDIIGTFLRINDRPVLVAGVLPASFDFASVFAPGTRADFYRPAILDEMRPWGNTLSVIGRLAPGVSVDQARAELEIVAPALRTANPAVFPFGVRVTSLRDQVSGSMRRPLFVLWGAVGLVLLIVCANLSNLLLARSTTRIKEFAVRLALGSGRGRLLQQLTMEGLVLACLGAALGVPLAWALTTWLRGQGTLAIPLLYHASVDGTVLLITGGLAIATGVLFSALPARRLAGARPQLALADHTRGSIGSRRQAWLRSSLVIVEVAAASVLLIAAGLLIRSFVQLLDSDLGFRPASTTVVTLKVGSQPTPADESRLLQEAARRVQALPGVDAAGLTDALPLDRNRSWAVRVPGQVVQPNQRLIAAFVYVVSAGYFDAMGIPRIAGRDFNDGDTAASPRVILLSQSLAQVLYPGQDAVGRFAQVRSGDPHRIIGVVADVRQTRVEDAAAAQIYILHVQGGGLPADLIVRSSMPTGPLVSSIRRQFADFDRSLLVTDVRPLTDVVERSLSPRRFLVMLLSGFSLFALLLAVVGIYSVVAYSVSQRTREIGIRMALGATAREVQWRVLRETVTLAVAGLTLGLAAAFGLSRVIRSLLFQTSPTDIATFAWTAGVLLAVAAAAAYLPARRASRIQPLTALQRE